MPNDPDDPPQELLDIWRQLDDNRRASLILVARALAEGDREEAIGERVIEQDGGGWGMG